MYTLTDVVLSRFLYLRNVLHGFARGILALRNLYTISYLLIPSFSTHPASPRPSHCPAPRRLLLPVISPPFPVIPSQLPDIMPISIVGVVISGFLVLLREIICLFTNIAKISSALKYASRSLLGTIS